MALLSAPTEEMLEAARALAREPQTPLHVADPLLQQAVEFVRDGLSDYFKAVCTAMVDEPPESPARAAFELGLAQRINSARLALSCGEEHDEPIAQGSV
ncbi:MAG TPA: hypothetical protein VGY13_04885 [Solirubrobacteraceae bacterium]|jgi:hypothetical protein|nr:hypothetical protein [Solirubrobacteraceae bacterium]